VTREVGYAIIAADGYETADEVVFAEPGDMILLGVRTLEGSASRAPDAPSCSSAVASRKPWTPLSCR
jgi:hypothetical protein